MFFSKYMNARLFGKTGLIPFQMIVRFQEFKYEDGV